MTERDNRGRFVSEHTDADVIAAVRDREPAATSEVADELGVTRQSADVRLRKLADAGQVSRKKIGAAAVWWVPDDADTPTGVDPDDAFWSATPGSSDESTDAAKTDEYLADALANE